MSKIKKGITIMLTLALTALLLAPAVLTALRSEIHRYIRGNAATSCAAGAVTVNNGAVCVALAVGDTLVHFDIQDVVQGPIGGVVFFNFGTGINPAPGIPL